MLLTLDLGLISVFHLNFAIFNEIVHWCFKKESDERENTLTDGIGAVTTEATMDGGPSLTSPPSPLLTIEVDFGLNVANFLQFNMLLCNGSWFGLPTRKWRRIVVRCQMKIEF